MNLACLELEILQKFRIAYPIPYLAKLFDEKEHDLRWYFNEAGILSPSDFVRSLPREELAHEISATSHREVADRYSVSVSFIKGLFQKPRFETDSLYQRFRSPSLVRRLSGDASFKGKGDVDFFAKMGDTRAARGRVAEQYFLELIKSSVDLNLEDPRAKADISCDEYGLLNVKTLASATSIWRVPSVNNCNFVAVYLTDKRGSMRLAGLVRSERTPVTVRRASDLDILFHDGLGFQL